ncbi:MAG: serine O-acetyltransferase EpsC [Thermoanaerobaculaceae bacterium]
MADECPPSGVPPVPEEAPLGPVVEALCASQNGMSRRHHEGHCRQVLPSRDAIVTMVEDLRTVLFPGYFGPSDLTDETMRFAVGHTLERVRRVLQEQIKRGLCFSCSRHPSRCPECEGQALALSERFLARLPEVRRLLATDVLAAYEGDPAATSPDEAIFCYPGVLAITNHRLAHELYGLGVPLIARIISEAAHSATGIDIHPGASIGERFFIDHGTGVVIGETSIIGANVRLYQGVTLGAKSFPKDEQGNPIKGIPRHPIVEDDVVIYAGATILGRVSIGRGSVIGGNVWVTRSLPPGSRISQAQTRDDAYDGGGGI